MSEEAKTRFFGKHSHGKRGVGSIIGAVFIVLIILSGFTFYSLYSGITDHYNKTLESMGSSDWNRNKEKLVIKDVKITATNQLNATVENQGTVQSHLIWFGLFNKSVVPESQTYYALDTSVDPAEVKSIVSDFTVVRGNKYVVQLVTELGNEIEYKFYPASEVRCALSLTTGSPTAYQGNNVTLMLTVKLNDTEVDSIQSLTVSIAAEPNGLVQLMGNSSLSVEGLAKGESAFFWWIYNAVSIGTVTFNATYSQAPIGTYALSTVNILASPGGAGQVTITGVNGTASYNPLQWNLLWSTAYVSGLISDLAGNDSSYAVFRSYYTGTITDINDFVDNNSSDVDGSANKGTHSNFTAQQYGPDSINDTLTEGNTGTTSLYEYYNTGDDDNGLGTQSGYKLCQTFSSSTSFNITSVKLLLYRAGSIGTLTVSIYATTGTPAYPTGSALTSGTTNADTLPTGSPYEWREITLTACTLNASTTYAIVIQNPGGVSNHVYWRNDATSPTYANGMYGRSTSSSGWGTDQMDNTRDCMFEVWGTSYNNQLDIEERFTSVDTGAYTNKELCIFAGTWSTSETLKVDVWNTTSSSWVTVIASLTKNAWNNVSIANLLTATVTIRFHDGTETNDTVQDSWNIDVSLLHLWTQTDQYTAEVEFTGSSNLQNWTKLLWQIQSCWDIGQVTVTIQLYNFTLGDYVSSGNGYLSYVSSVTPNTNELMSQTITSSPNDFKNSTGHWRVKIKGVKSTSTQFLMKVDWIDYTTTYSTSGNIIPYNAWQWYTIKATTASGDPIPYAYVSVYANGTSVAFRNVTDKASIVNPAWVRLNANGEFQLEIRSTSGSAETFVLYAVVGSVVGQKTIVQEAS